ncbi:hypothetical protein PAXRUDRAFT_170033, partial [Paxillus rubicundulus Ve08.2h10]
GHTPGEGMQKAVELGEHTAAEADKIAKEYSKQHSTILKLAGLSGSSTPSILDWNRYQAWYVSKHPKDEDGKWVIFDATTHCQQMKAHFDEHKDKEQFSKIWEDVHKHTLLHLADTMDLKPAQVHNLIMKMWETTQNILIAGVILYTGPGEADCHASGVFSGSDILIKLTKEKKYDMEYFFVSGQWGSNLHLRCRQWGKATDAPLPNLSATANPCEEYLLCGDLETPQDRNRHILPLIMSEKYEAVGIPTNQKANFSWTHTLNIMWKHQVWVVDWPARVVPLGPGFSTNGKGVTSEMLDAICMPLLKSRMDKVHYHHEELHLIRKTVTKGRGKAKGKGKEKEKEISDIPIPDTEFEIVLWSESQIVPFAGSGLLIYFYRI